MLQPYAGDCAPVASCPFVPTLRAAQLAVARATSGVTAAVTVDLGDALAPAGSVHSRRKQEVASRLVAGAMLTRFGAASQAGPVYGPTYSLARDSSSGASLSAEVTFDGSTVGATLVLLTDGASCPVGVSPTAPNVTDCAWFAIQGSMSGWVNATTVTLVNATSIRLSAQGAAGEVALATAFGQASWPVATLFSDGAAGNAPPLPAIPWNETTI